VESAASIGASHAVADRGEFAVGVHHATDFLRPSTGARVDVEANALYQGRTQPLWEGVITESATGKQRSRARLRAQAAPLPSAPPDRLRLPDQPGRDYPCARSRSAFLRIFPVEVVGRASTNSTALGAL